MTYLFAPAAPAGTVPPPPPAASMHTTLADWKNLGSKDPKNAQQRNGVFVWLRPPDAKPTDSWPYMPKLLGDEPYILPGWVIHQRVRLTLTATQYALLQQWAKGDFIESAVVPPPVPTKLTITPEGLDRAALENCAGGSFFPGIEVGWQIRDPSIYAEPFRIRPGALSPYLGDGNVVREGHFTRQMTLPWQADFLQCKSEDSEPGLWPGLDPWGWWPAQRPDLVFASDKDFTAIPPKTSRWHRATKAKVKTTWPVGFDGDHETPSFEEMLDNWRKFGFIIEDKKKKGVFIEDQRGPDIP